MEFVDTHVHLHFPDFDEDRSTVIERARAEGVKLFLNVGTDIATSEICIELAEKHDFIYAAAGIHPHDTEGVTQDDLKAIEEMLKHPKVVALGEIGLDFFREHSSHEVQIDRLKDFFGIYKRNNKPLVIHCRDAYEKFIEMLRDEGEKQYRGVMHCYSSDKKTMKQLVELGFYISFAGPLTYKKNDSLREALKACPVERVLIETDAPFLPPQPWRGKRNETLYMLETARVGAEVTGMTLEAFGKQTTENAKRLFGI